MFSSFKNKLFSVSFFLAIYIAFFSYSFADNTTSSDTLTPYIYHHGSKFNHRFIRECHRNLYDSAPHELHLAHTPNISLPFVKVMRFVKNNWSSFQKNIIRGHYAIVSDPLKTLSVLEPNQIGGCSLNIRQTVVETAKQKNCILALNAGYFDTKNGKCLGNVISDGKLAQDSGGIQNAHFGLKNDGNIFVGYISEEEISKESGTFKQLVGGVVWLLRDGKNYVNESKSLECEDTEETGPMDDFVNILSARTAVGHDKDGKIIVVHVDGNSGHDGISLWDFQNLLREFGVQNAINLDGGGSSTFVVNGTVINYPYDSCSDAALSCDRKVSTILCVHSPYCEPENCNNHGSCIMGQCKCENNWLPPQCDRLMCENRNCSSHGFCTEHGCLCESGFKGNDCDISCSDGWFGVGCKNRCDCMNQAACNPINGFCNCPPGFIGTKCEHVCPYGYFGQNCLQRCTCNNSCFCDPTNGACNNPNISSLKTAEECIAKMLGKEQSHIEDNSEERRKWNVTILILSVITTICITSSLLLVFYSCSCSCRSKQRLCSKNKKRAYRKHYALAPDKTLSDSSDSEHISMSVEKR